MLKNTGLGGACQSRLGSSKLWCMMLNEWLAAEKGRSAALAAHFGVSPAAVSQWKSNGVPLAHMKAVRDFTGGAVTLEEMVPEPAVRPSEEVRDAA